MQVQVDAPQYVLKIENPLTAPSKDFDLFVETGNKAAVLSPDEIVGDFLPPGLEQLQERIKTLQGAVLILPDPALDFGLGLFPG